MLPYRTMGRRRCIGYYERWSEIKEKMGSRRFDLCEEGGGNYSVEGMEWCAGCTDSEWAVVESVRVMRGMEWYCGII